MENEIKQENIFSLAGGIKTAENLPERHNKVRFDGRPQIYISWVQLFLQN